VLLWKRERDDIEVDGDVVTNARAKDETMPHSMIDVTHLLSHHIERNTKGVAKTLRDPSKIEANRKGMKFES